MAVLRYKDEHNKVGYLQKPKGSDDYHQILDFLGASNIRSPELGPPAILATIDATPYTITEDSVRGQLQLADDGGIDDLPIADIYSGMDNLGYVTKGKLTFYKNKFITQWRQQTSDPIAPVYKHGQSSDPDITSFSQVQETNDAPFTSTNVDDKPLGGSFHAFPPRSTQASPTGQTLGGAEDPITLTALSSVVSTLVQKVISLETKLKAHKKLFKDVVGKLVKQVKAIEVKLKIKKRKVVVSDSNKEDGGEQDVDLDALHALANAAVTVDSTKSPVTDVPSGLLLLFRQPFLLVSQTIPTREVSIPLLLNQFLLGVGQQQLPPTKLLPSSPVKRCPKGKSDAMSQDFEMTKDQRKRQQEVLASAVNYSDAAWEIILARLQANPNLSSTIFGVYFTDDFAAKMVALNQGHDVYTTGWTMAQVRKLSPEQLQEEFNKIQRVVAFTRGLKRDGRPMTTAFSKKLKTGDVENIPEAQVEVHSQEATVKDVVVPSNIASKAQQTASSLKKVGTKKKLLGRKGVHTSQSTIPIEEGDPDAKHKLCIKYASDEDSASDCDTPVHLYAVVDWELLPTGLGSINAIYRLDNSRKYFTSLREILHLILMDSPEVNDGSDFWKNQHTWSIQSWKLYSFSGVHVLETVSGLVIHMFVDKKYPLSIQLIERMLDHQLEICHETVGNELTTAVQLIAFLKKQISDSKRPKVHEWVINSPCYHNKELASPEQTATAEVVPKSVAGSSFPAASSTYVVPTGRVVVPTGRYVVPAGKVIIIVSPGRLNLVPTGRILSPGKVK
ncbi:hypothetical protein Tco_0526914 [Tanacetum coccineum]